MIDSEYLQKNNYMPRKGTYYNRTNTCDECKTNKLTPGNTFREYGKNDNWTGKWLCRDCWWKNDYKNRSDSYNNIRKEIADFRLNNLDPNSTTGKGYIFEQITCKARGIDNLNIENDNFSSKLDHTRDSKYGILQSKGATYSPKYDRWHNGSMINEYGKEFDYIIFYCMDIYMKNVERVYIFPRGEIIKRSSVTVHKNPSRGGQWYEKYRVDEKLYNDAYHNLDDDDLKGLRNYHKKDSFK